MRVPSRPETLTAPAVREYVAAHEHATIFNGAAREGARNIYLDCDAVVDLVGDEGAYAYAACGGSYRTADGAHADLGWRPIPYLVTTERTVRVAHDERRHYEQVAEEVYGYDEGGNEVGFAALSAYNYDTRDHRLGVRVRHLDPADQPVIYEERTPLAPGQAIVHGSVTADTGSYRVEAALETGPSGTATWDVTTDADRELTPAVYATPAGTVRVRQPPLDALGP